MPLQKRVQISRPAARSNTVAPQRHPPTRTPANSHSWETQRRPEEFNAVCDGTTADNGFYGEGIVNAGRAVARR